MNSFNIVRVSVACFFALILSGCGAFMVKTEPDFEPKMRYSSEPIKVKVAKDKNGEFYLTDMEDDIIRRPWKAVGTFKAMGPTMTSWWGAARQVGCDAFWIANEVTTHSAAASTVTITRSFEGTVAGVNMGYGDQLCIIFTDDEAVAERESEVNWVVTAYQRPPMNAGWNFANNISFNGGYTMALEKYLRHIPLGLAVRAGTANGPNEDTWFTAGGMVMIPALNLWKLQLAPTAGLISGIGEGIECDDASMQTTLFGLAGGYADLVVARFFALGFGVEYWIALDEVSNAPDGLNMLFRYGFAF